MEMLVPGIADFDDSASITTLGTSANVIVGGVIVAVLWEAMAELMAAKILF